MKGGDDINLFSFIKHRVLHLGAKENASAEDGEGVFFELLGACREVYVRELAFNVAVNLVANAVGKCEFKTYQGWKEYKGAEYWRWNYAPNRNESSSVFLHKLIWQLHRHNHALVIERAGQRLVADAFTKTHNAVKEDVFSQIQVDDLSINTTFRSRDVLYFRLNHKNMYPVLQGLGSSYAALLEAAQKAYQWNAGNHGIINVDAIKAGDADGKWVEAYNDVLMRFVKPYFQSNNGVMPMFNGFSYEEKGRDTSRTQQNTRDIRAMIDDVFEITAKGFQIPAVLMKGEVQGTKDAVDGLLTFCVDPMCDQIQEEGTRKIYGYEGFIAGDYMQVDTTRIRHYDMFANAAGVEKLISSGVYSINDIIKATGGTAIEAGWANKHFITKNFTDIMKLAALEDDNGS